MKQWVFLACHDWDFSLRDGIYLVLCFDLSFTELETAFCFSFMSVLSRNCFKLFTFCRLSIPYYCSNHRMTMNQCEVQTHASGQHCVRTQHVVTCLIEHQNKRTVGILLVCWGNGLIGFKPHATRANNMQHNPTWCSNERNMFCLVMLGDVVQIFVCACPQDP